MGNKTLKQDNYLYSNKNDLSVFDAEKNRLVSVLSLIQDQITRYKSKIIEYDDLHRNTYEVLDKRDALIELKKAKKNFNTLMESVDEPYFLRVDFYEKEDITRKNNIRYIGKHDVDDKYNRVVYGWQYYYNHFSTIDQITEFYPYTGESNSVPCVISLKRKFNIKNGELIKIYNDYSRFADSDEQEIIDPFLLDVLKEKRKIPNISNIIKTIQKDQAFIMTLPMKNNIIVQGVAGSGKTMIMFHRLSYLLYHESSLKPNEISIVVPNTLFINQIMPLVSDLTLNKTPIYTVFRFYRKMLQLYNQDFSLAHSKIEHDQLSYSKNASLFLKSEKYVETYLNESFSKIMQEDYVVLNETIKIFSSVIKFDIEAHSISYHNIMKFINEVSPFLQKVGQYILEKQNNDKIRKNKKEHILVFHGEVEHQIKTIDEIIKHKTERANAYLSFGVMIKTIVESNLENKIGSNENIKSIGRFKRNHDLFQSYRSNLSLKEEDFLDYIKKQIDYLVKNKKLSRISFKPKILDGYNSLLVHLRNDVIKSKNEIISLNKKMSVLKQLFSNLENTEHKIDKQFLLQNFPNLSDVLSNYMTSISESTLGNNKLDNFEQVFFSYYLENQSKYKALTNFINDFPQRYKNSKFILNRFLNLHDAEFDYLYRDHLFVYLSITKFVLKKTTNHIMPKLIFIDEGQDFSKSEYLLIRDIFKESGVNIYGDINQSLFPRLNISSWRDIGDKTYVVKELNQNYRNTHQITTFCNSLLKTNMEAIGINGEEPKTVAFNDCLEMIAQKQSEESNNRYVIISSFKNKKSITERIKMFNRINKFSIVDYNRLILDVFEAKGLEFEIVFVFEKEMTPQERYVAYTRALKQLYIVK